MTRSSDDRLPEENNPASDAPVLERVQELTWAAMDEVASDDDVRLLESLLLSDDEACENYLGCVQLHVDLLAHFSAESAKGSPAAKSPVLGFLNEGPPPFVVEPEAPEDSRP